MPEWCAVNWGSLKRVRDIVITTRLIFATYINNDVGAYLDLTKSTDKDAVIGEVNCVGTEAELLECSHASVGVHHCYESPSNYYYYYYYYYYDYYDDGDDDGDDDNKNSDIIISCYGIFQYRLNHHVCTSVFVCIFMHAACSHMSN